MTYTKEMTKLLGILQYNFATESMNLKDKTHTYIHMSRNDKKHVENMGAGRLSIHTPPTWGKEKKRKEREKEREGRGEGGEEGEGREGEGEEGEEEGEEGKGGGEEEEEEEEERKKERKKEKKERKIDENFTTSVQFVRYKNRNDATFLSSNCKVGQCCYICCKEFPTKLELCKSEPQEMKEALNTHTHTHTHKVHVEALT
jgi:hypothetical protein